MSSAGFRLTDRDRRIVRAVYECRALTTRQVERLFFWPPTASGKIDTRCQKRLQLLHEHRFLYRDEQPQKISDGRKPYVYFLDQRGAELLAEAMGSWPDWQLGDNDVGDAFIEHLLFTNDVRVAITVAARLHGVRLRQWIDDRDLRKRQNHDRVTIKGPQGGEIKRSIVPDGYFHMTVETNGRPSHAHCFLEADRGTVTGQSAKWARRDWAQKIAAYNEYAASDAFKQRYGAPRFRMLTVTTTMERLRNLKWVTEQAGGKRRYWFTTIDEVQPERVFAAPIWHVATERRPRRILP